MLAETQTQVLPSAPGPAPGFAANCETGGAVGGRAPATDRIGALV